MARFVLSTLLLLSVGCASGPPLHECVPPEFRGDVPVSDRGYTGMRGRTIGGVILYPEDLGDFETGFKSAGGKAAFVGEKVQAQIRLLYAADLPEIEAFHLAAFACPPLPAEQEGQVDAVLEALQGEVLGKGTAQVQDDGVTWVGELSLPSAPFVRGPAGEAPVCLVSVLYLDRNRVAVREVLPLVVRTLD